ncbi:hypothetical protein GOP47_0027470 [Adiantum capillus-veneris]|nr:hypothetical protein GOP47_0027470 [Adiantum capillus-veneris]
MAAMATIPIQLPRYQRVQNAFGQTTVGGLRPSYMQWVSTRTASCKSKLGVCLRAQASSSELAGAVDWGEPISLGTVKLPDNINLQKLDILLYQWGSNLTQNANLPLPAPIKVDKIKGGVRLGYIRLVDGAIEDLAHIDCCVFPGTKDSSAMFRAVRSGRFKDQVPPGEALIMQSLLQSLKMSIQLAKM